MRCLSCGRENPEGFRFCGNCGAPFPDVATGREVRKLVTVVFCHLIGSTALGDGADPETVRATMRGYYDQIRLILELWERYGYTCESNRVQRLLAKP
ncbi:MAG: hypothetical protein QOH48_991 [Actinomycetota bacterium]|nr:hypothetical protein [Actinomycetota bacterium]